MVNIVSNGHSATILQFPSMARKSKIERFPNRIREHRTKADLTLEQLGEMSGIHFANLAKLETGARELKAHHMEQLSRALKVAQADLLNQEDGGLTAEERALIDTYRDLPASMRKSFDALKDSHQPFRGAGEVVPMSKSDDERKSA